MLLIEDKPKNGAGRCSVIGLFFCAAPTFVSTAELSVGYILIFVTRENNLEVEGDILRRNLSDIRKLMRFVYSPWR